MDKVYEICSHFLKCKMILCFSIENNNCVGENKKKTKKQTISIFLYNHACRDSFILVNNLILRVNLMSQAIMHSFVYSFIIQIVSYLSDKTSATIPTIPRYIANSRFPTGKIQCSIITSTAM